MKKIIFYSLLICLTACKPQKVDVAQQLYDKLMEDLKDGTLDEYCFGTSAVAPYMNIYIDEYTLRVIGRGKWVKILIDWKETEFTFTREQQLEIVKLVNPYSHGRDIAPRKK